MNINDLICVGANPISFQDHITTTKDKAEYIPEVLSGIMESCQEHYVLLTGGETEILKETKFQISGSAVGTVQLANLITSKYWPFGSASMCLSNLYRI
jgi:phosphoribosylformylglycinamidine cyclo-ligase